MQTTIMIGPCLTGTCTSRFRLNVVKLRGETDRQVQDKIQRDQTTRHPARFANATALSESTAQVLEAFRRAQARMVRVRELRGGQETHI